MRKNSDVGFFPRVLVARYWNRYVRRCKFGHQRVRPFWLRLVPIGIVLWHEMRIVGRGIFICDLYRLLCLHSNYARSELTSVMREQNRSCGRLKGIPVQRFTGLNVHKNVGELSGFDNDVFGEQLLSITGLALRVCATIDPLGL